MKSEVTGAIVESARRELLDTISEAIKQFEDKTELAVYSIDIMRDRVMRDNLRSVFAGISVEIKLY
jgi:hypothetical protein